jgi:glycogen operon protein
MLVSQGVTLLGGGDELGRTQGGNNNAYCQDGPISWYDWTASDDSAAMTRFTARAVALQAAHPALRRRTFLTGARDGASPLPDVTWLGPDGAVLAGGAWDEPGARFLGWLLAGDRVDLIDAAGAPLRDDDVLVLANAGPDPVTLPLPGRTGASWTVELDTGSSDGAPASATPSAVGTPITVAPLTLVVATAPLRND